MPALLIFIMISTIGYNSSNYYNDCEDKEFKGEACLKAKELNDFYKKYNLIKE